MDARQIMAVGGGFAVGCAIGYLVGYKWDDIITKIKGIEDREDHQVEENTPVDNYVQESPYFSVGIDVSDEPETTQVKVNSEKENLLKQRKSRTYKARTKYTEADQDGDKFVMGTKPKPDLGDMVDYTRYSAKYDEEAEVTEEMAERYVRNVFGENYREYEQEVDEDDTISVSYPDEHDLPEITKDQFMNENPNYEKHVIAWYEDDDIFAMDDDLEEVSGVDLLGGIPISRLVNDSQTRYYRDDENLTDYELYKASGSYSDAIEELGV